MANSPEDTPEPGEALAIGGWPKGMDNVAPEGSLPLDTLRYAQNVDITKEGKVLMREGSTSKLAISDGHSLWSNNDLAMCIEATVLTRIVKTAGVYSKSTLRSGMSPEQRVSYVDVNGDVYYTNSEVTGKVLMDGTATPMGVEVPSGQPTVTAGTGGALPAGTYQVGVTFESDAGEESGAKRCASVVVPDNGLVSLSVIPQPVDSLATKINIYMTKLDGDTPYRHTTVAVGVTSATLNKVYNQSVQMTTQFMDVPPAGQLITNYNGRNFIAKGNTIWFTESLRYGLCNLRESVFMFAKDVDLMVPVKGGIYVAAGNRTWFLGGPDALDMEQTEVLQYGAVRHAVTDLPQEGMSENDELPAVAWMSHKGFIYGYANGAVKNMSAEHVAIEQHVVGALAYKEFEGRRKLVSTLQGDDENQSLGFSDTATAEIRRNGVIIT